MTIEQFYQWAMENGVENFKIRLADEDWYLDIKSIIIDTDSNEVSF